jgi:hypothetical protein
VAILTLEEAKTILGVTNGDEDDALDLLVAGACAAVEKFVGRKIERAAYTEYLDGQGYPDLVLRQRPVASVEGVRLDWAGYYGAGPGAFPAETALVEGVDFVLVRDDGGESISGLLRKIGPRSGRSGTVTPARARPAWPEGQGNVRVAYTAGYDPVPDDVKVVAAGLVGYWRRSLPNGGLGPTGEKLGEYQYTLGQLQQAGSSALASLGEFGSARQILGKYKEFPL